jgi:outer membrane protein assembly factor BamB
MMRSFAIPLFTMLLYAVAPAARAQHLPDDLARAEKVWEVSLGSHQYGIPAISGNRVFLALNDRGVTDPRIERTDGGLVMCLDLLTGKTEWKLVFPRFTNPRGDPHYFDH